MAETPEQHKQRLRDEAMQAFRRHQMHPSGEAPRVVGGPAPQREPKEQPGILTRLLNGLRIN